MVLVSTWRRRAGDLLVAANNGRVVTRAIPVRAAAQSREALIAAGVLIPPSRPLNLLDIVPAPHAPEQPSLSTILEETRAER
ncbi:hypothetical protein BKG71_23125 [Mycobacteroides chelonae]|nr:hypothetical protein BKG71_23125 [Mycobacteroides chelonae]